MADHKDCVLAIVGSRGVPDYQSESIIKQTILEHSPRVIVSGGSGSVDFAAARAAKSMGISLIQFLPSKRTWDWDGTGEPEDIVTANGMDIIVPGGFKQRNQKIAEMCDCLVRIASMNTKTYGSGWTADYAEKLGKRVSRFTV